MGSPVQVEACSSAFRSIRLDLPALAGKLLGEAPLRVPVGGFGLHRMASTPPKPMLADAAIPAGKQWFHSVGRCRQAFAQARCRRIKSRCDWPDTSMGLTAGQVVTVRAKVRGLPVQRAEISSRTTSTD